MYVVNWQVKKEGGATPLFRGSRGWVPVAAETDRECKRKNPSLG